MRSRFNDNSFHQWVTEGFPFGRLFGVEILVHWTSVAIFFILLLRTITPAGGENWDSISTALTYFCLLTFVVWGSILLHEFGHCFGDRLMGGHPDRVILWPLGGLAVCESTHRSPYAEFVVTACGPLTSLALAILGSILYWALPSSLAQVSMGWWVLQFVALLSGINWGLFIFNMFLPLFPMDCARLIRSAWSMKISAEKVTYYVCLLGIAVGGGLIFLSIAGHVLPLQIRRYDMVLPLIGLLGLMTCLSELRALPYTTVYSDPMHGKELFNSFANRLRSYGHVFSHLFGRSQSRYRMRRPSRPASRDLVTAGMAVNKSERRGSEKETLDRELEDAVKREDFLLAAKLRDQIHSLQVENPAEKNLK